MDVPANRTSEKPGRSVGVVYCAFSFHLDAAVCERSAGFGSVAVQIECVLYSVRVAHFLSSLLAVAGEATPNRTAATITARTLTLG
jgi:hypothetical protein